MILGGPVTGEGVMPISLQTQMALPILAAFHIADFSGELWSAQMPKSGSDKLLSTHNSPVLAL